MRVRPGLARGVEERNQVLAASAWQIGQMRPQRRMKENSIDWGNFTAVEGNKFHPFTTDNLELSDTPSSQFTHDELLYRTIFRNHPQLHF